MAATLPTSGRPPSGRVVTIDGPAGAGKSVTARTLSARHGLLYLDSGALYRACAHALVRGQRAGEAPAQNAGDAQLETWLEGLPLRAESRAGSFRVLLGEEEITAELRQEEIGELASRLATRPPVRARVAGLLREVSRGHDCVAEGRDMGTVVFPDAALKVYLTASLEVRIRRRVAQLAQEGIAVDPRQVRARMEERDARDRARAHSPLRVPAGAVRIDTTDLALDEQVDLIAAFFRGRGRLRGSVFYRGVKSTARLFFSGLLGARTEGTQHVPPGACLFASNHRSYADPPLVGCLAPGEIAFLAKEELFRIPLLGPLIRRLNAVPVRRGAVDRKALRMALDHLRRGRPLLIFPEGTRVRGERLGAPRGGVAWLARRSGVPVVPTRVTGGGLLRSFLRSDCLRVRFGPPLTFPPEGSGAAADEAFATAVMSAIDRLGT